MATNSFTDVQPAETSPKKVAVGPVWKKGGGTFEGSNPNPTTCPAVDASNCKWWKQKCHVIWR